MSVQRIKKSRNRGVVQREEPRGLPGERIRVRRVRAVGMEVRRRTRREVREGEMCEYLGVEGIIQSNTVIFAVTEPNFALAVSHNICEPVNHREEMTLHSRKEYHMFPRYHHPFTH